ncbi:hypothetical protein [Streptomyces sp. V1I1]|uniref:hypothetical protein n=1 Tax=Streptomyces sp. V1I1 TaxID=3042272 RepID=UPI0027836979|nr:hypothetical protein [Streptomyces sp. V1I1]MDQ0943460.1 hypothetical protein [Streptomyces sp. V1I1]
MPLNRRHFLQTAALALGPVALTGHAALDAAAVPKRAALIPPVSLLAPGSITARGWPARQLHPS